MSKLRHNIVGIILMITVIIVAHPLPCSANRRHPNGRNLTPRRHNSGTKHRSEIRLLPNVENMDLELSNLFKQLDRSTWNGKQDNDSADAFQLLQRSKEKAKAIYNNNAGSGEQQRDPNEDRACPQEQEQQGDPNEDRARPHEQEQPRNRNQDNARQLELQQHRFEQIQNEAADREFERMMKMNLQRSRVEGPVPVHRGVTKKPDGRVILFQALNFCKKSKQKSKSTKPKLKTTTESPSTDSPCPVPTTKKVRVQANPGCKKSQLRTESPEHLLQITKGMKKRALLIIKNLNLLEMEILNRWPASCGKKQPGGSTSKPRTTKTAQSRSSVTPETSTPMATTEQAPAVSMSDSEPNEKTHERLDKPMSISTATTQLPSKPSIGFYFGYRPPGEENTHANMAAALKEEQRLEQKVREEHQMHREITLPEREQQRRRHWLQSKRKRARYGTAPAVKLNYPNSDHVRAKETPEITQEKPSALLTRNCQPLNISKNLGWNKRKSNNEMLFSVALKNKAQMQRQQRHYKKARHRMHSDNPLLAPN